MSNKKEYRKQYYEKNKEKEKERSNQWNKDNHKKMIENQRRYYKNNCEKLKERSRQWTRDNPEYKKEYDKQNQKHKTEWQKQWRRNNPEKMKQYQKNSIEYQRQWSKNNPEKVKQSRDNQKENRKLWMNIKRKTDLKYSLNHKIDGAILKSLKRNKKHYYWEDLVGYILEDLIKRLKKTIPKGYTWQDYIQGKLHIDHIIPKSAFNYTKVEHTDFKRCWALNNLQLLPAKENLRKGKKIGKEFQPTLKI